jgi:hypothetical protein
MKDEKMLELAAKAASILFRGYDSYYEDFSAYCEDTDVNYQWNPLNNDGDALRLAVMLQIDIKQYGDYVVAWFDGGYIGTGQIHYDNDPYAATRKAIVCAAAAIGENM